MIPATLPKRQVHLDFHTGEQVPDVGIAFDGAAFARTLTEAHVDSIVLFAKCHHGWSYCDTKVGARHPNLAFDLLRAQVDACRAAGIRTTIYLSAGFDERAARENPGWRRISPDGTFHMMLGKNLDPWWSYLCFNTPYLDELIAQVRELALNFAESDGLWLDIVREAECCCNFCRADMDASGLDWTNSTHRRTHARIVARRYHARVTEAARAIRPGIGIFHNASQIARGDRALQDQFSHFEIEAVPTGGWGYDHLPLAARYLDPLGLPIMGVTVRFHIVWGELGGYRHPNALRAELATMHAHGATLCVGDHLDVDGTLDSDAYRLIGRAFAEAKAREPALEGLRPVADVGLLSSLAVRDPGSLRRAERHNPEDEGALRVLQEGHFLHDVLDAEADFARYRLLVLPDRVRLDAALADRLRTYLAAGGRVLMTGESGLHALEPGFALNIGAEAIGPSPCDNVQIRPIPALRPPGIDGPFLIYSPTMRVRANAGEALGEVYEPLFNRTARHFSGHINTPRQRKPSGFHSGVHLGGITYLAQPLFTLYHTLGQTFVRDHVIRALDAALGARTIEVDAPARALVTLRRDGSRNVIQIVHAPRDLRGQSPLGPIEVIEDLPSLMGIRLALRMPSRPIAVTLADGTAVAWDYVDGRAKFGTPDVIGDCLIEVR